MTKRDVSRLTPSPPPGDVRLRVVSNFGDGDSGVGEIHARARNSRRRDAIGAPKNSRDVSPCGRHISRTPESPKLDYLQSSPRGRGRWRGPYGLRALEIIMGGPQPYCFGNQAGNLHGRVLTRVVDFQS